MITQEAAEKLGMTPHPKTQGELFRNLKLGMIYQSYQSEVDRCSCHEDVVKLGIIPKKLGVKGASIFRGVAEC